jgi:hypothetical protein
LPSGRERWPRLHAPAPPDRGRAFA